MAINAVDYAHVRLTVTDIEKSRAFYDAVFGFEVAIEATPDNMFFTFGGVIYQFGGGLLGLRPMAPGTDSFSPDRVGLDHVAFAVPARSDLDDAVTVLDGLGITHEGVKDIGQGFILEFRDPDGIALELFTPKA